MKERKKLFREIDRLAFQEVTEFVTEIQDKIDSRAPMAMSGCKLTPVDYLICFQQCVKNAKLNTGAAKHLARLLDGEEIGEGSKNFLISKLGKMFMRPVYSLFPRNRFFVSKQAFLDSQKRRRSNLILPQKAGALGDIIASLDVNAGLRKRRYRPEGAPPIREYVIPPKVESSPEPAPVAPQPKRIDLSTIDLSGFQRQELEA